MNGFKEKFLIRKFFNNEHLTNLKLRSFESPSHLVAVNQKLPETDFCLHVFFSLQF